MYKYVCICVLPMFKACPLMEATLRVNISMGDKSLTIRRTDFEIQPEKQQNKTYKQKKQQQWATKIGEEVCLLLGLTKLAEFIFY